MHPVLFQFPEWVPFLGSQDVTSFGLFMFFAFVTAGVVLQTEMERIGWEKEKAWDLIFMAVIGGIIGAKLYYVFLNFDQLQTEGLSFVFSRSGMVWYGGFILATVLVAWELRRSDLSVARGADLCAPALALAYAVGRMGCFMVGDDWGRPTSLPWGIRFPEGSPPTTVGVIEQGYGVPVDPSFVEQFGQMVPGLGQVVPVHPTQIYEILLSVGIFFVLWRLRRHAHRAGWLFMLWLAFAGAERFTVEIFRLKDDRFFGPLTLAQVISLVLIAVGIWGMRRLADRSGEGAERAPEPA